MTWQLVVTLIVAFVTSNALVAWATIGYVKRKYAAETRETNAKAARAEIEVSQMLQESDIQLSDKEIDVVKKMSGVMGELITRNKELTTDLMTTQREKSGLEVQIAEMTKDREIVRHEINSIRRQTTRQHEELNRIEVRLDEIEKSLDGSGNH